MLKVLSGAFAYALVMFLAGCAIADEASDRDELIAAYLEWRGGEAFTSATSLVQEGTAEAFGLSGPAQLIETRDGYSRTEVTFDIFHGLDILTPEQGWTLNTNGQTEDMGTRSETDAHRALARDFALPLIEGAGDVTRIADEEREGQTWGVLRIAYEDGDYSDFFIDPESGALEWIRNRQDTDETWNRYDDWQVVDGVRLPGRSELLFPDAGNNVAFTWETFYVNAPIPPIAFEPTEGEDRVSIAGGAASTGWIPINYFREQRIFLPATLNGLATEVILDSGADVTVVDSATAEAAGLVSTGAFEATGTGGTQQASFASGVDLRIGDLELHDLTVAIVDLSGLAPRLGRALPVILGKEVFNETIVDIDYPNRRIAFHDPEQWTYDGAGNRTALLEVEGSRSVEISVEGGAPISVGFDIGQGAALTLYEAYVNEAGLMDGRPVSDVLGGGVGGVRVSPISRVASVTFGGITFEDVPAAFIVGAEGAFDTVREQGNLGTEIFNRTRMIVNYGADELILEPDAALVAAPFDANTAGVQGMVTVEGLLVSHVMANSPALAAGLTNEDVIVSINGAPVTADYWENGQWRWSQAAPGTEVTLTLSGGRELSFTTARFY